MPPVIPRRTFLRGASATTLMLACASVLGPAPVFGATAIPNSGSTRRPQLVMPAGACDAHIHVIDPGFAPAVAGTPAITGMSFDDYRLLQRSNGTSRVVVVQPKYYGTDNRCTLDAVARAAGRGRGIAVIHPDIAEAELRRLDEGGICGVRLSLWNPNESITTFDMLVPLAERIRELGWHIQLHLSGDQIVEQAQLIEQVKVPIVFDHMGRLPPAQGIQHPAFTVMRRLIDADRAWVKLSGAYLNTAIGSPTYADATKVAQAFVQAAPERVVWGSDWPHVTEVHKPDDSRLVDLLVEWTGGAQQLQRLLVDNPGRLYGFDSLG